MHIKCIKLTRQNIDKTKAVPVYFANENQKHTLLPLFKVIAYEHN